MKKSTILPLAPSVPPENNTTAYIYDTEGRPTTIQDPLNGTIKSGYDGIGRQTGLENRLANTYKTVYASGTTGMTVTGTTPMLTRSEIKTDMRGLVTEVLQPSGHVIKIVEHDDEGRAVKQEVHAPDDGGVIATRIYYYLPNGLVTGIKETINGIIRQSSYTYEASRRRQAEGVRTFFVTFLLTRISLSLFWSHATTAAHPTSWCLVSCPQSRQLPQ
jgi:YD repeat-containing protein